MNKINKMIVFILVVVSFLCTVVSFTPRMQTRVISRGMNMEYIPDGLSKAQYEKIKKKEEEDLKKANLGAIGITKFKSRSFEAWQKSGGKNLFPVDPNSPDYEKPYMQRKGGSADGTDLIKKGIKATELKAGAKPIARSAVDAKYDDLEAKGLLKSAPFELPWSNKQAAKVVSTLPGKLSPEQVAAQARKRAAGPTKVADTKAATPAKPFFSFGAKPAPAPVPPPPPAPTPKKFFGLF